MTDQRRRDAKERKRRERLRQRKTRQVDAVRCDQLLFEAEIEWRDQRVERAERLLERVVRIDARHVEAHLHLAEIAFVTGRSEKGLRHFERLPVDAVPTSMVFHAANASLASGEFDRGEALAREFLWRLGRGPEAESLRAAARVLIEQCRKGRRSAARVARASTGQADLLKP